MMKAPAEHRRYLAKKSYPLGRSVGIFENDELAFLSRHGFWIEALVGGVISPTSDEQKRLTDVHAGKIEPISL
jgi:uncharacterized protein YifE (UPF0438 family)